MGRSGRLLTQRGVQFCREAATDERAPLAGFRVWQDVGGGAHGAGGGASPGASGVAGAPGRESLDSSLHQSHLEPFENGSFAVCPRPTESDCLGETHWPMGDGRSPGSKGRCPSHVGSVEGRQGGGAPAGRTGKRGAARRLSQCGCSFLALASGRFRVSHSHRWLTKNVVLLRTPLSPSGFLGATARSGADAS